MRRFIVNEPQSAQITAQITGEPREIERLTRGSEGGRWKSTHRGNSLAAYPTARPVRRGVWGDVRKVTRPVPTRSRLSAVVSAAPRAHPALSSPQNPSGLDAGFPGRPDRARGDRHLRHRVDPSHP